MIRDVKYVAKSPEGMARAARALLARAKKSSRASAFVLGLSGDLGAGKTTFVKMLARELGVKRNVTSPTFILERNYPIPRTSRYAKYFARLAHIDAYRLTKHDPTFSHHLFRLMRDPRLIILIEWPERITMLLPKGTAHISFSAPNEHTRVVEMK